MNDDKVKQFLGELVDLCQKHKMRLEAGRDYRIIVVEAKLGTSLLDYFDDEAKRLYGLPYL